MSRFSPLPAPVCEERGRGEGENYGKSQKGCNTQTPIFLVFPKTIYLTGATGLYPSPLPFSSHTGAGRGERQALSANL